MSDAIRLRILILRTMVRAFRYIPSRKQPDQHFLETLADDIIHEIHAGISDPDTIAQMYDNAVRKVPVTKIPTIDSTD
jgi:hypothetical protein